MKLRGSGSVFFPEAAVKPKAQKALTRTRCQRPTCHLGVLGEALSLFTHSFIHLFTVYSNQFLGQSYNCGDDAAKGAKCLEEMEELK